LLHDGGGNRQQTVEALSAIIPKLKQQGYRFVTVPQLLQIQAGQKQRIADQKSP
jgi:chitin deacetylase